MSDQDFEFNQYIKKLQDKEFNDRADNEISEKYDRIVYCDLDGVLVDFRKGVANLGFTIPPTDRINPQDDEMWKAIESIGKDKFFADLDWMNDGKQLWEFITNNFINVKILTALGKADQKDKLTTKGKRMWLSRNIPMINNHDIIMVPNKHAKKHYAKPGYILIDDTNLCIDEWVKNGGIGLLHKSAVDTIRKLERYV